MNYIVNLEWDSTAEVWVATSEDVPGLVLEASSRDVLMERVRQAAPELLDFACETANKLQEAEREAERTEERYSSEEVLWAMKDAINLQG